MLQPRLSPEHTFNLNKIMYKMVYSLKFFEVQLFAQNARITQNI